MRQHPNLDFPEVLGRRLLQDHQKRFRHAARYFSSKVTLIFFKALF